MNRQKRYLIKVNISVLKALPSRRTLTVRWGKDRCTAAAAGQVQFNKTGLDRQRK